MDETSVMTEPEQATLEVKRRKKGRHGLGHVYEHRANWWLDVKIKRERHRMKLGPMKLLEKREARQIADEKIKALLMPKPDQPELGTIPFKEFAKEFVAWAARTKRSWKRCEGKTPEQTPLLHCVQFFGDTPLKDITPSLIEDFRSVLLARKVGERYMKAASVNRNVAVLRHAFNWAVQQKHADHNPVKDLVKTMLDEEHERAPTRVLEEDDQAKFLAKLPHWLRMVTVFALQTGARRGEVVNLKWEAVHPESVEFTGTKTGESRFVPLSTDARAILITLKPAYAAPEAFVFEPSVPRKTVISRIRRCWRRALKQSGIAKVRVHDLRHTALSRMVARGVDLRTVQLIAGHASVKTTERYLHSNDRRKAEAVEKLSGILALDALRSETGLAELAVSDRIN